MDHSNDYTKLFDLTGKVCVVTGGSGYIGVQFTKALLAYGAFVAVADIMEEPLWDKAPLAEELLEKRKYFVCDVASADSIRDCFSAVADQTGRIDVLVNSAVYCKGHGADSNLEFMSDEIFAYGVDGSVGTIFRATREAVPFMKEKGGSIINISSMYGVVSPDPQLYGDSGQNNPPNYGAGKAAVLQFTRYSGAHLAKYGIRVNAITPGPFPCPANTTEEEFNARLSRKTMLNRFGHPSELAGACVLLASDASSFMTGTNIIVDGGWTAW